MAGAGIDVLRAANLDDRLGGVAEGAGGIDHVVEEDAVLALDIADDVHDLALVGLLAALVDDGQTHVQLLGKRACAGHGADVRGDDDHLLSALAELLGIVVDEDGVAEQVVHRDIKEALNLRRVQVHRQDAVGAGGGQHVRDKLGGDGVAALGLAVLPGIAEVGDDRRHAARGGALAGIDHDEQLHEAVIDRLAGGVDEEHVAAADGLVQRDGRLAVGERLDLGLAELGAEDLADLGCKRRIGVASEQFDILAMRKHFLHTHFLSDLKTSLVVFNGVGVRGVYFFPQVLRRRAAQPSLFVWRVRAMASAPAGTSSVTVEPAAV